MPQLSSSSTLARAFWNSQSSQFSWIWLDGDVAAVNEEEAAKLIARAMEGGVNYYDWSRQGDATIGQRLELIEKQRQSVLDQQKQLEDTLLMLDYKRWYYQTAREAGTCAGPNRLT